jgi:hypothetical protein
MNDDTPTFGHAPFGEELDLDLDGGLALVDRHGNGPDGEPDDDFDEDITGRLIRPYAITGGRTGADGPEIHLESQIQATADAATCLTSFRWETAKVIDLVREPMALVEVSARLSIPIGVTRVLVADLLAAGSVILHTPTKNQSFTSLLEKVLDGVRNL